MSDVELIKPDKKLAIKLDYIIDKKNKRDWKQGYHRLCMILGTDSLPQGNKTDYEYYEAVMKPKFQYYLLEGNNVIGRVQTSRRGNNFIDIQYVKIEDEFQGQGYGTKLFQMLEEEIREDEQIEGIIIEDASILGQTTRIARKLGYEQNEYGQFIKYRQNKEKKTSL